MATPVDDALPAREPLPAPVRARVPLKLPAYFSSRAVALVMAEKFGWRGLRLGLMVITPAVYFWWKQYNTTIFLILYAATIVALLLLILTIWTAKESLDQFAKKHAENAWLLLDDVGIGGESGAEKFMIPWDQLRRVVERGGCWLLETNRGAWMVVPTSQFNGEAWALMRAHRRALPARR